MENPKINPLKTNPLEYAKQVAPDQRLYKNLTERYLSDALKRSREMAFAYGKGSYPRVLFVCKQNAGRSPLFSEILNIITGTECAKSAGTIVGDDGGVNKTGWRLAKDIMDTVESSLNEHIADLNLPYLCRQELSIRLRNFRRRQLSKSDIDNADIVYFLMAPWEVEDPANKVPDYLKESEKRIDLPFADFPRQALDPVSGKIVKRTREMVCKAISDIYFTTEKLSSAIKPMEAK